MIATWNDVNKGRLKDQLDAGLVGVWMDDDRNVIEYLWPGGEKHVFVNTGSFPPEAFLKLAVKLDLLQVDASLFFHVGDLVEALSKSASKVDNGLVDIFLAVHHQPRTGHRLLKEKP